MSLFVQDKKIDTLINQIINKSKYLVADPDIESKDKHTAEKSVSSYMPKVINSYKKINPTLRTIKGNNKQSAYEMTIEQLEVILNGLEKIEYNLLPKKQDSLKVSGKFLNEVFDKNTKELEL